MRYLLFYCILLIATVSYSQNCESCNDPVGTFTIAIDKDNTHVRGLGNQLILRSIIHHPYLGNHNAAHQLCISIISDSSGEPRETFARIDDRSYPVSHSDNVTTVIIDSLERFDHISIKHIESKRCSYDF